MLRLGTLLHRVDGTNEMLKEMECTKETEAGDPIYASIPSLNGQQCETSECAQSSAPPLPSGDDLIGRAMPNPYASLPLEQSTMDDYGDGTVTEAAFVNDSIDPQQTNLNDSHLPVDCDRNANAQGTTVDNGANGLNHATPSHVQMGHMPQDVLKRDQAVDGTATYSQVGVCVVGIHSTNDEYVRTERTDTDVSPFSGDDATSSATVPLEEDYIEMKST